jgi:hypothetical protein
MSDRYTLINKYERGVMGFTIYVFIDQKTGELVMRKLKPKF